LEGAKHPDRDAQFRYLNQQARAHLAAGQPVVSVDTKKKELVGRFAGGGAEWQPSGEPEQVRRGSNIQLLSYSLVTQQSSANGTPLDVRRGRRTAGGVRTM
jgi:hypothetical protein